MINTDLITNNTRCTNLSNFTNDKLIKMINSFLMVTEKIFPTEIKLNKELERKKEASQNYGDFDTLLALTNEYTKNKMPSLRNVCSRIAQRLGFNISNNGTKYLIESILYVYEYNIDVPKLKTIYQELAKKHSVPICSIKSSINYSITSALPTLKENKLLFAEIFSEYDGRIPNAKYLIVLGVYELRHHLQPEGYDDKRIEKILFYA